MLPVLSTVFSLGVLYRNIPLESYASLMIFYTVIGAFTISDFGVGRITCTKIVRCTQEGSVPDSAVVNGLYASAFLASGLFLPTYVVASLVPGLSPWSSILAGVTVAFTTFFNGCKGVLEGYQDFKGLVKFKIAQSVLIYLLPAIGSFYSASVLSLLCIVVAVRVASACAIFLIGVRQKSRLSKSLFDSAQLAEYVVLGKWAFLSNAVSIILTYFDRLLVIKMLGPISTSAYLSAVDVTNKSTVITGGVLQAGYGKLVEIGRDGKQQVPNSVFIVVALTFLVALALFYFVGQAAVAIWLGAANTTVFYLFLILIIAVCFNSLAQVSFYALLARFKQKEIAVLHAVELILYIPLAWLLVARYGVFGGAVSLAIRNAVDFSALRILEFKLMERGS